MMTALRPITLQDGVFDLSNQRHPKNLPMMTGDAVTRLLDGKEEEIVELDLTINRLKKLENLDKLVNLELLCLRTNHISRIENLEPCGKTLQHLDMYENRITVLEHLATICPSLTFLDLSFNEIRGNIASGELDFPHLKELYLVQNKIDVVPVFPAVLTSLVTLELGANRIRVIENLDLLVNLESLWLGKNKIEKIDNLSALTNLKKLSLQNNRITKIENLGDLVHLEELYLSENGITEISGLDALVTLDILDLGMNRVENIGGVEKLVELTELWLNNNRIDHLGQQLDALKNNNKLETIYLAANPVAKHPQYRPVVISAVPTLTQLDANMVVRKSPLEEGR